MPKLTLPSGSGFLSPGSVDQGLVDELLELGADRMGAGWEELGHEQGRDLLQRVDPEGGAGRATPGELAGAGEHLVLSRVLDDREPEAEAHTVERRLREQRAAERLEIGATGQVVGRHVVDRAGAEQADTVELAAAQQHLAEPVVIGGRRDKAAAARQAGGHGGGGAAHGVVARRLSGSRRGYI